MTHFRQTFMGVNGFEDLKRYTRAGTDFGREIVSVLNERIQLEQMYSKNLRRLGQRISKASCLIVPSPLSNAWNSVGLEMEKEADIHKEFGSDLLEKCIKPLSIITESQLRCRRNAEQRVEASYKVWTDKYTDHVKLKKRLHIQRRENESLIDQIDSPKVKNDKEQQKLINKQQKTEESVHKIDIEYYNSLLILEKSRQEWEHCSFQCCDTIENMEDDRYREICHVIRRYSDVMYDLPSKIKSCCRRIDDSVDNLSSSKEILVVAEKFRGFEYFSEQLLCDYYQENFNFPMNVGRRKKSLQKLLERFINDYQKENCHRDGLKRIEDASIKSDVDISSRVLQSTSMLNFLDVIRFKLNRTLATIEGSSSKPSHVFEKSIEETTDRQGIKFSTLKLRPGDDAEKIKEKFRRRSKGTSKNRSSSAESQKSSKVSQNSNFHEDKSASTSLRSSRPLSSLLPSMTLTDTSEAPPSYDAINDEVAVDDTVLCQCIVLYDYEAKREDEMTIYVDDVIQVFEKGEDQWWRGRLLDDVTESRVTSGLFPANYVQILNTI